MKLPTYLLRRPPFDLSDEIVTSFEELFAEQVLAADGESIDYPLPTPKWQFLNYLCESKEIVVHGSGNSAINEFEPRQSNDAVEFGNQQAVYAASDGIWASYYAILDRDRYVRSLVNTCQRIVDPDGEKKSYYYFSINEDALPHNPWRTGTIYILPRRTFERESAPEGRESAQWRSFSAVKPLAKISVRPEDFPFLGQIRGHDMPTVMRRSEKNPDGFPWLEDEDI